mmetsp:Transcript_60989/g.132253  ORF Transcript_60989/g.132253 Transcript_60989/m.132253 type:complete len:458 (-) Transcript_60989:86-1459(-)|eukprot:CAMPEP_0170581632 /NCGR_PEP_ID=MMETSP0224-20130122/7145_1 /TAXON_ID=285029 /ORGANISM="Togula jolla, Strain CCCM 725" /LENGTH=457 /DNA_ID=CAMNT_0010904785 /DNA_START=68 /DNA_END=1441 /DNA_ORIENTATION=-
MRETSRLSWVKSTASGDSTLSDDKATLRFAASSLGFLADSYDLFAIDLVVMNLELIYGESIIGVASKSLMVSMMIAGIIVGQLSFGFIADLCGRRWTFVATAVLTVLGALASASVYAEDPALLPGRLAFCRFFLGLGVGGEYPLSATVTAEAARSSESRGRSMSMVVGMQGWGMLLPCLVALIALSTRLPQEHLWRVLLGLGAVPSAAALCLRLQLHESAVFESSQHERQTSEGAEGTFEILSRYKGTLCGTASAWLLANLSLYGLGSFKSTIFREVVHIENESPVWQLRHAATFSACLSLFAIFGFILAFLLINRAGRFQMQLGGFIALGATFSFIAGLRSLTPVSNTLIYLLLLGMMFVFQNCGPNTTTFIIPAEAFPTRVRATCHGISAASGKIGAVLGTAAFSPAEASFGLGSVFAACSVFAMAGAAVTWLLTPRHPLEFDKLDDDKVSEGLS